MARKIKTGRGWIVLLGLLLAGCGVQKKANRMALEYRDYQGQEIARFALSLQPAPRHVLLLGYAVQTPGDFLGGLLTACARTLKQQSIVISESRIEADSLGLQASGEGVDEETLQEFLKAHPETDVVISFVGAPAEVIPGGPRWILFSANAPNAQKAVEKGAVQIAIVPRSGPPPEGPQKTWEDRFAAEYEILRAE